MNTMSFSEWIIAAAVLVAAAGVAIAVIRLIRNDGYGTGHGFDARSDWGSSSTPSVPYSTLP